MVKTLIYNDSTNPAQNHKMEAVDNRIRVIHFLGKFLKYLIKEKYKDMFRTYII